MVFVIIFHQKRVNQIKCVYWIPCPCKISYICDTEKVSFRNKIKGTEKVSKQSVEFLLHSFYISHVFPLIPS